MNVNVNQHYKTNEPFKTDKFASTSRTVYASGLVYILKGLNLKKVIFNFMRTNCCYKNEMSNFLLKCYL